MLTFDSRHPKSKPFSIPSNKQQMMQNDYHEGYFWHAYAAIECIAAAINATDQIEGDVLSHWLHHHQVSTTLGKLTWDTNGDLMDDNYKIYIWDKSGSYRPISIN